jgi:hypothetical protein
LPNVHSAPCTTCYRCLPKGVTGSRSRHTPPGFGQIVLRRPHAWVRVSFAHTRVSIVGWIYDPDHSLPAGMYVDVPHLDCLLVAAPVTVEGSRWPTSAPDRRDGFRTRGGVFRSHRCNRRTRFAVGGSSTGAPNGEYYSRAARCVSRLAEGAKAGGCETPTSSARRWSAMRAGRRSCSAGPRPWRCRLPSLPTL